MYSDKACYMLLGFIYICATNTQQMGKLLVILSISFPWNLSFIFLGTSVKSRLLLWIPKILFFTSSCFILVSEQIRLKSSTQCHLGVFGVPHGAASVNTLYSCNCDELLIPETTPESFGTDTTMARDSSFMSFRASPMAPVMPICLNRTRREVFTKKWPVVVKLPFGSPSFVRILIHFYAIHRCTCVDLEWSWTSQTVCWQL